MKLEIKIVWHTGLIYVIFFILLQVEGDSLTECKQSEYL